MGNEHTQILNCYINSMAKQLKTKRPSVYGKEKTAKTHQMRTN